MLALPPKQIQIKFGICNPSALPPSHQRAESSQQFQSFQRSSKTGSTGAKTSVAQNTLTSLLNQRDLSADLRGDARFISNQHIIGLNEQANLAQTLEKPAASRPKTSECYQRRRSMCDAQMKMPLKNERKDRMSSVNSQLLIESIPVAAGSNLDSALMMPELCTLNNLQNLQMSYQSSQQSANNKLTWQGKKLILKHVQQTYHKLKKIGKANGGNAPQHSYNVSQVSQLLNRSQAASVTQKNHTQLSIDLGAPGGQPFEAGNALILASHTLPKEAIYLESVRNQKCGPDAEAKCSLDNLQDTIPGKPPLMQRSPL